MFTLMPSAVSLRTATAPSVVPGTLIMTFGRDTVFQSRCASAIVAAESCAAAGETSIDTKPSWPFAASYTGRKMSHAARTSSVSTSSNISHAVQLPAASLSCASYAVPCASAFSKIVGFDVIPVSASPGMRSASSPLCSIVRSM